MWENVVAVSPKNLYSLPLSLGKELMELVSVTGEGTSYLESMSTPSNYAGVPLECCSERMY